jgi:hypothetical protein
MSMLRPYIGPEEIRTIKTLEYLHCPRCTADLSTEGFASAFWTAEVIVYFCWCGFCGWLGDISELLAVTSFEAEEGEDEGVPFQPRVVGMPPS